MLYWGGQCPGEFPNKAKMVYTGWCYLGNSRRRYSLVGRFFSLETDLELCEELPDSIITWTVSYKYFWPTNKSCPVMDGSSKVNGQYSICKTTTRTEGDKNKSSQWGESCALLLAVVEELNNDKSLCLGFHPTHGPWLCPGHMAMQKDKENLVC